MPNTYFDFKQFRIDQGQSGMKVTTEGCILGALASADHPQCILDIGAGTGLLSLMLAQKYPEASIDAVELEPDAAAEATGNFERSKWSSNLVLHHTSIQEFSASSDREYDLIVCNPPFFNNTQRSLNNKKTWATHSDQLSTSDLADNLHNLLSSNGVAYVLYPLSESKEFQTELRYKTLTLEEETLIYDRETKPVFRRIMKVIRSTYTTASSQSLSIKEQDGRYSEKFIQLLKPYYLHL